MSSPVLDFTHEVPSGHELNELGVQR
jgi:hypothetical protein